MASNDHFMPLPELQSELDEAGLALRQFAEGPARQTAEAMQALFAETGQAISEELSRAAQKGELDFKAMAKTILEELAIIAAQEIFSGGGGATPNTGQTNTFNLAFGSGSDASSVIRSSSQIGAMLAGLTAKGGRFS